MIKEKEKLLFWNEFKNKLINYICRVSIEDRTVVIKISFAYAISAKELYNKIVYGDDKK